MRIHTYGYWAIWTEWEEGLMNGLHPKQQAMARSIANNRITFATGSVGSGKTFGAAGAWVWYGYRNFSRRDFGVCTRTAKQFENPFLECVHEFFGSRLKLKRRTNGYEFGRGNRLLSFIGSDSSSLGKIRGANLAGAFVDEFPKQPREFVAEANLRCRIPGARLVYTCNPEGPLHWAKTDFIDQADKLKAGLFEFRLEDNPSLDEDFVESAKVSAKGIMYQRLIEGKWAAATGLIYPHAFDVISIDPPDVRAEYYDIAIDVANSGVTHALLIGTFANGMIWVLDEWRHDGATEGQWTNGQQIMEIMKKFSHHNIRYFYVDPEAKGFKVFLDRYQNLLHGLTNVVPVDNDVKNGIELVNMWMMDKRLQISKNDCPELVRELGSYSWDEKAALKGEDRPMKLNDHGADALRYYCYTRSLQESLPRIPGLVKAY